VHLERSTWRASPRYDVDMKKQAKSVKVSSKVKSRRRLTKADLERVLGGVSGNNETHTGTPTSMLGTNETHTSTPTS
jgi:hypothetical protein